MNRTQCRTKSNQGTSLLTSNGYSLSEGCKNHLLFISPFLLQYRSSQWIISVPNSTPALSSVNTFYKEAMNASVKMLFFLKWAFLHRNYKLNFILTYIPLLNNCISALLQGQLMYILPTSTYEVLMGR